MQTKYDSYYLGGYKKKTLQFLNYLKSKDPEKHFHNRSETSVRKEKDRDRPLDLKSATEKLKRGEYKGSVEHFAKDIRHMFGAALKNYQKGNPIYNCADTLLAEFEKHYGKYQKKMREYENKDNNEHRHRRRHRDRERRRDKRQNSVNDEKKQRRSQPNDPQKRKRKLSQLKKGETQNQKNTTNVNNLENETTRNNKLNEEIETESNIKKKKRTNQENNKNNSNSNNNANSNNLDEKAAYSKLNELMPQSYQMDQKFDVGENFQDVQNIIQQAFSEKFGSPEYIQKLTMAFKLTKEIQNTLLMLCYEVLPFPMALLELVDSVDPPFPSFNKNEFGSFSFEFEEPKNLSKSKTQKNNQPNETGDQGLNKEDQDQGNDDDDEALFSQTDIVKLGLEINRLSELNKVKITNFITNKLYDKDVDSEENMMQVDLFTMSTRKLIQLKKFVKKIIKLEEKRRITKKEEKELEEIDKQLEKLN
ncbi:bromodomain-containing protein [Anaeramoeba flamelloides]|uniref:Bromodomain-containing protein n=1 Tax=Anaeramoeba flamelloides TaxID=1746091 RepID=A0AAV7YLS8_9EUKA|nr:bromodomain-containing protein [Anaeramoeba flamelloides]